MYMICDASDNKLTRQYKTENKTTVINCYRKGKVKNKKKAQI